MKLHQVKSIGKITMTSAPALPRMISKIFYFALAAIVVVFVSMLLLTGIHP
jgi:hypothetical protein